MRKIYIKVSRLYNTCIILENKLYTYIKNLSHFFVSSLIRDNTRTNREKNSFKIDGNKDDETQHVSIIMKIDHRRPVLIVHVVQYHGFYLERSVCR